MKQFIFVFSFVFLLAFSHSVLADFSQDDYLSQGNWFSGPSFEDSQAPVQSLGTGITGTFGNFSLYLDSYPNSTHTAYLKLYECDTFEDAKTIIFPSCVLKDTYSQFIGIADTEESAYAGIPTLYTFSNGSGVVANSNKYYSFVLVADIDFGAVRVWGSQFSSPNAYVWASNSSSPYEWPPQIEGSTEPLNSLYFAITGVNSTTFPNTSVTIDPFLNLITIDSPQNGDIIASPFLVTFSGSYNYSSAFGPVYDKIHFEIIDFNTLQEVETADLSLTTGVQSFSFQRQLANNHHYTFRAYFFNSTDSSILPFYSAQIDFDTGTSTGFGGNINQFTALWDNLKTKPPFGYFTLSYNALLGLDNNSTPAFTLVQMPILMTLIFTPLRTGLIWVLWVVFLFAFIKRLKHIEI